MKSVQWMGQEYGKRGGQATYQTSWDVQSCTHQCVIGSMFNRVPRGKLEHGCPISVIQAAWVDSGHELFEACNVFIHGMELGGIQGRSEQGRYK